MFLIQTVTLCFSVGWGQLPLWFDSPPGVWTPARWRRSLRRDDELESDDRSASSLAFESGRSRLCELHSRSCISKVEKEILSLTTPGSGMKALAHIGAWHNSLDRIAAVILVSPLLNYLLITLPSKYFLAQ